MAYDYYDYLRRKPLSEERVTCREITLGDVVLDYVTQKRENVHEEIRNVFSVIRGKNPEGAKIVAIKAQKRLMLGYTGRNGQIDSETKISLLSWLEEEINRS